MSEREVGSPRSYKCQALRIAFKRSASSPASSQGQRHQARLRQPWRAPEHSITSSPAHHEPSVTEPVSASRGEHPSIVSPRAQRHIGPSVTEPASASRGEHSSIVSPRAQRHLEPSVTEPTSASCGAESTPSPRA